MNKKKREPFHVSLGNPFFWHSMCMFVCVWIKNEDFLKQPKKNNIKINKKSSNERNEWGNKRIDNNCYVKVMGCSIIICCYLICRQGMEVIETNWAEMTFFKEQNYGATFQMNFYKIHKKDKIFEP